jgi:hypothetical protein
MGQAAPMAKFSAQFNGIHFLYVNFSNARWCGGAWPSLAGVMRYGFDARARLP